MQGEPVSGTLGIEESTSGMSGELEIPAYQAVAPRKIVAFKIEKLDRTNVSSWKVQYKLFLRTQGCWSVVEHTYNWRGNAPWVKKLLEDPAWEALDAMAKLYILQNIKVEDKASVLRLETSGDMWAFLMKKYERRTQVDVTNAIRKVTRWQMDPKMSLEGAMQQLDQYNAELEDISSGKVKFDSMAILIIFLNGLPSKYDSMKFSLPVHEDLTRGVVLSRLQQQDSMMSTAKENWIVSANLTKTNVTTWKSDVREFCQIQGVWEVVEQTLRRQNKPEELQKLLDQPLWASQDATARYYIMKSIKEEDMTAVRDMKSSGAVWKYLMSRYERTTQYDTVRLAQRITQWKKNPKVDIEASLQQLEQLNADLYEVSDQKIKLHELMILVIFLNGLPEEYSTMRDCLFGNIPLERGFILSRLQQKELQLRNSTSEKTGKSANRAEQRKCFNCGKRGHLIRDCGASKDLEQSNSWENPQGRSHRKGQSRARIHGNGRDKSRPAEEQLGSC